jgi:microcin C transport system substrate-binding protein
MRFTCALAILALSTACGSGSAPAPPSTAGEPATRGPVSLDKSSYPAFPNVDAGADASVPSDQGGRGFTGEGWQTSTDFDLIGDPRALKGGVIREAQLSFPGTLRIYGPESNTVLNGAIQDVVYEALLVVHPTTLEFIPGLASHWQISEDKLTYRYRIDPNARFSDGQPVTAEDVVASWSFVMDKGLQEPMSQLVYAKFDKPVAESKYIVRVKCNQLNWRNFLYFSAALPILPAHVLKTIDGPAYVRNYNFKLLPGSGPYTVGDADVLKGKSVAIRRRNDYWAEKYRRNVGRNNFDEIREIVVRDYNLQLEMFKKGDLDYFDFNVNRARQWVQDLNFDKVQRGLIQKRKVFNDNPVGTRGLVFNTRKAPYNDIRLRKALAFLLNRKLIIEKLYFNEPMPLHSHYAGLYENPNNPKNEYNPQEALRLLAEVGWKERNARGELIRDRQPLNIELLYSQREQEPFLTTYQSDLRKVGIGLNLRLVTPETRFALIMERKFDLVSLGWTGLVFPNPETSYSSTLADVNNTNNVDGIKSARIDELLQIYDREFDPRKRIEIIREIDGIVANYYGYILLWENAFQAIAYWNKFGHPEGYLSRIGDYRDIISFWWIDPEKQRTLARAMTDASVKMEIGPTDVRPWQHHEPSTQQ